MDVPDFMHFTDWLNCLNEQVHGCSLIYSVGVFKSVTYVIFYYMTNQLHNW